MPLDRSGKLKVTRRDQNRSKGRARRQESSGDIRQLVSNSAVPRGGELVWREVVLVCLAVVVAGCSPGSQAGVEQPVVTRTTTAQPETSGADRPTEASGMGLQDGSRGVSKDWPRPPFAGMYAYHPQMMFHLEEWQGIVSIEPPCVYLIFDPDSFLADGERLRLALSLPYPKVRFDEDTQTLWSGDIPIAHGDRVLTGGNEIFQTVEGKEPDEMHLFWDVCTAHWVGIVSGMESVEWYCARDLSKLGWGPEQNQHRKCVEDTRPRNQRELLERQGLAPVTEPPATGREPGEPPPVAELDPPPFLGMHPYLSDMELEVAKLVGVLTIEPARQDDYSLMCAYLYPIAASAQQTPLWGDSWKYTGPEGQPLAVRLDLPYPQVRFDEDAATLWNGDIGPMSIGDRVIVDPLVPPDFNDNGYDNHKQPHEPQIHPCRRAGASATVLDIQPVEYYCTHDPPARHQGQCEQAMSQRGQAQSNLTLPE